MRPTLLLVLLAALFAGVGGLTVEPAPTEEVAADPWSEEARAALRASVEESIRRELDAAHLLTPDSAAFAAAAAKTIDAMAALDWDALREVYGPHNAIPERVVAPRRRALLTCRRNDRPPALASLSEEEYETFIREASAHQLFRHPEPYHARMRDIAIIEGGVVCALAREREAEFIQLFKKYERYRWEHGPRSGNPGFGNTSYSLGADSIIDAARSGGLKGELMFTAQVEGGVRVMVALTFYRTHDGWWLPASMRGDYLQRASLPRRVPRL